jgi:2-phosphosulfolactate phosphatase
VRKTVTIDYLPERAAFYRRGWAVVVVDVIRATTSAVTLAAMGRKCYPVGTLPAAFELASSLPNPLLVGELKGDMPEGFDMNNSPADLAALTDRERPIVLLSTSGTKVIHEARAADAIYVSCFRNFTATTQYLAGRHTRIAVIGAGSRGEFREEDQMGCAWVAQQLLEAGYHANENTRSIIEQWRNAPPEACANGNSAAYLRRTNQERDLDFILQRIDDIDQAFVLKNNVVERADAPAPLPIPMFGSAVYTYGG